VKNGLTEVEVTRFPKVMCTDRGRAINNNLEPGWEKTLTGLPKELYEFWERQLKPRGYKIKFQVVDFFRRGAGRHRHNAEVGLSGSASRPEPHCS